MEFDPKRRTVLRTAGALFAGGTLGAAGTAAASSSVAIEYSPTSPMLGTTVTFTADVSSFDGTVDSYQWTFEDVNNELETSKFETSKTGETVTQTIERDDFWYSTGIPLETPIETTLTVTDTNGNTATDTVTVTWYDSNESPTAVIDIQDDGAPGGYVTFDGSGSYDPDDSLISRDFDWTVQEIDGPATYSVSGETVTKDVRTASDFEVTLQVADDQGATDTTTTQFSTAGSSSPPGITDGQTYKLLNLESGAALDVSGFSGADGADVQVWDYLGGANQQWTVESTGDGYYKLRNVNSGKLLDVSGVSTDDGANVHQWSDVGGENQQWAIDQTAPGVYKLTARHSGKVLEVDGFSGSNGETVQQWGDGGGTTQRWTLFPVDDSYVPDVTLANDNRWESDGVGYVELDVTNEEPTAIAVNPTVTADGTVVNYNEPDHVVPAGETRRILVSFTDYESADSISLTIGDRTVDLQTVPYLAFPEGSL